MKVSELDGALLNFWVAKAEGRKVVLYTTEASKLIAVDTEDYFSDPVVEYRGADRTFGSRCDYSTWGKAGPIIGREKIDIRYDLEWYASVMQVDCTISGATPYYGKGSTPLLAAMRCYVASTFGDEVEPV